MRSVMSFVSALSLIAFSCAPTMGAQASMDVTEGVETIDRSKGHVDQDFITAAVMECMLQVEAARVAMHRKSLPDNLWNGAITLIEENARIYAGLTHVAAEDGLSVPTRFDAKHQAIGDRLFYCPQSRFVNAYVSLQAESHEELILLFKQEEENSSDLKLRVFARTTVSALQTHPRGGGNLP